MFNDSGVLGRPYWLASFGEWVAHWTSVSRNCKIWRRPSFIWVCRVLPSLQLDTSRSCKTMGMGPLCRTVCLTTPHLMVVTNYTALWWSGLLRAVLDSAEAGIEPAISGRKSSTLTTLPPESECQYDCCCWHYTFAVFRIFTEVWLDSERRWLLFCSRSIRGGRAFFRVWCSTYRS